MNPSLSVVAALRDGIFTRSDARACGYPESDIDYLVKSGSWRRVQRGMFTSRRGLRLVTPEMLYQRQVARTLAPTLPGEPRRSRFGERQPELVASHQSAAALQGLPLWGLDLSLVHVTTPKGRPGRSAGGLYRHVRDPVGPGVIRWNRLALSSLPRAVAEVAATSARAPAVVLADAALASGLVSQATLRRAAEQLPRLSTRALAAIAAAVPDSSSAAESRLRLILTDAGFPTPSPYAWPYHPGATEPTMDPTASLWFPDQRTVVEFDPRRPYWRPDPDDDSPPPDLPSGPEPVEYCWISWKDLDNPTLVATRIHTTFTRATRRTAVRHLPGKP